MKTFCLSCAAFILCLCLTACSPTKAHPLSDALGLDLSSETVVTHSDSHGGFHGDGLTYTVLAFSDQEVLKQIQASEAWHELPMDETATVLVYGITQVASDRVIQRGPYLSTDDGPIPEIKNGYYRLIDRQAENDASSVLDRESLNITLGIYDADTHLLYYFRFDT